MPATNTMISEPQGTEKIAEADIQVNTVTGTATTKIETHRD